MAHFALVNEQNVVEQVIVIANDDCGGGQFPESEPIGQTFITNMGLTGLWLQTSYHANFRAAYAAPGMVYNPTMDEFMVNTNE
jgi:hypothetical protein